MWNKETWFIKYKGTEIPKVVENLNSFSNTENKSKKDNWFIEYKEKNYEYKIDNNKYKEYLKQKENAINLSENLSKEEKDTVLLLISKTEDILDDIKLNNIKNPELKQNFLTYYKVLDNNLNLLLDDNKQNDNLPLLEKSFNKFVNYFTKFAKENSWNFNKIQWFIYWVWEGVKNTWEFISEEVQEIIEFFSSFENISKIPGLLLKIVENYKEIFELLSDQAKSSFESLIRNFESLNDLNNKNQISDKLYTFKSTSLWISIIWITLYSIIPVTKFKYIKSVDELDEIVNKLVEKWSKKLKLEKGVDKATKTTVYKRLSENFPLLWVNRLQKWDDVYNISFWWIKHINDIYWQKTTDEVLDFIKKEIKTWVDAWNRIVRENYKNLTFTLNNKNIQDILWDNKKEFIKKVLEKNMNHLKTKVDWDYYTFEQKVLDNLFIWIWKSKVKWWKDQDKLNAFYQSEISARHEQTDIVKGIEYSKERIESMAKKAIDLEKKIMDKFSWKTYLNNGEYMQVIIENHNWNKIINTDLLKRIRKWRSIWDNRELKEMVDEYIKTLNNGFDFIAPYINAKKDMKVAKQIEKEIQKWEFDIDHYVKDFKWTLAKWVFEAFIKSKTWSLYFIDIKDMWIMNLADFRKFAKQVNEKWADNVDLTETWKSVTETFKKFVNELKKEHPNLKIALWWDEIYIYDENYIDISSSISKNLENNWIKWRITQHHWQIDANTIKNLDINTVIIKKVEESIESQFPKMKKYIPNIEMSNTIKIENPDKLDIKIDNAKISKLKENESTIVWTVDQKPIKANYKSKDLLELTVLEK